MQRSTSVFWWLAAILIAGMLTLTATVYGPLPAAAESGEAAPAIWLRATTFVPALGQEPDIPASLRLDDEALRRMERDASAVYLVQFSGPVVDAWIDELLDRGAEVLGYIPDYAFKVRMSPAAAKQVAALAHTLYVGPFHPAYRLSPDLAVVGRGIFELTLEPGASPQVVRAAVELYGGAVLAIDEHVGVISADAADLARLATLSDVAWIQERQELVTHNDVAAGQMNAAPAWSAGYNGQGQKLTVADTGLDTGNKGTVHMDFRNRVANLASWPIQPGWNTAVNNPGADDGSADLGSGHGTHVLGSAGGNGARSGGLYKGIAPGATLNLQAIEQWVNYNPLYEAQGYRDGYALAGIPDDLANLFNQAYLWGSRIHTNSWGASKAGLYNSNSRETDAFMWGHKDMTILFSAGNEGVDSNRDGIVDPDSIGSPATAKNVITVGAVENLKPNPSPNANSGTYGSWWPSDFPVNPLKDDPMADAGDRGMVAFSSRGPTDDGRIKPDVVAPGTWILSVRSSRASSDGWGNPLNQYYMYMGGTSMATPLTAGAATVVRDFYVRGMNHANPSAALVKGTLINTADDIAGQYAGSKNDAGPIPNNDEGWGAVNLGAAVDKAHRVFEDDPQAALRTGERKATRYWVTPGRPFKVTLVWTDYPGTESAAKALVNDLDLTVKAPDGSIYKGNRFSGGWTVVGGAADRTNNVECVYIQNPAQGEYEIAVRGNNVPVGPQAYALVLTGNVGSRCQDGAASAIEQPAANATVQGTVTVSGWAADFTAAQGTGVTGVRVLVDGAQVGTATYGAFRQDIADAWGSRFGPSGYTYQLNTVAMADGQRTLQIQSQGACGWKTTSERTIVVRNQCDLLVAADRPGNGATITGTLTIGGWAADRNSASGTGIDSVGVWLDGPRGQGTQVLNITQFHARQDIAGILGPQFLNSGYQGMWDSSAAGNGAHRLYIQAHSPSCGWSTAKTIDINVQNTACDLRVAVDTPGSGATVAGSVLVKGWAVNLLGTSGTGVDSVGVWLDGPRGQGTQILNITQFHARQDIASILGQRYLNSGYQGTWDSSTAGNGAHRLYIYAHGPGCGWSPPKVIDITIQNESCDPRVAVDAPRPGATVAGSVLVKGWAVDLSSGSGTGIDAVGVWLDGPRGQGTQVLNITQFHARQDIAGIIGQRFLNSGYQGTWNAAGVGNGAHTLYIYGHSPTCGWSPAKMVAVQVQNVACDLRLAVDRPANGATVRDQVDISGWSVDLLSTSGTGVDQVGIWLDGPMGQGTQLFDIRGFHPRPDLVPILGPTKANSGWHRSWNASNVASGQHTLYIYPHSPSCGWGPAKMVTVQVQNSACDVRLAVDRPANGATLKGNADISGWAVDLRTTSGTGVDQVGIWLDGPMGQGTQLFDIRGFHARPDLVPVLGPTKANSGWHRSWNTANVADGQHVLYIAAHSPTCGWAPAKMVTVTVSNGDPSTLFEDDFSDPTSGWTESDETLVTREYRNGEYRVLVKDDYRAAFSAAPGVLCTNCGVEVDARFATGVYETLGILFGITDLWDTYLYEVSATGWFRLRMYKDGQWATLLDWTASPDLLLGMGTNHLRVVRNSNNIVLFANGTRLITLQDAQLTGQLRVGLVATSGASTPVDARFDNFRAFSVGTPTEAGEWSEMEWAGGAVFDAEEASPES